MRIRPRMVHPPAMPVGARHSLGMQPDVMQLPPHAQPLPHAYQQYVPIPNYQHMQPMIQGKGAHTPPQDCDYQMHAAPQAQQAILHQTMRSDAAMGGHPYPPPMLREQVERIVVDANAGSQRPRRQMLPQERQAQTQAKPTSAAVNSPPFSVGPLSMPVGDQHNQHLPEEPPPSVNSAPDCCKTCGKLGHKRKSSSLCEMYAPRPGRKSRREASAKCIGSKRTSPPTTPVMAI
jgi:hypothetical protein